jgi:hypothetical protein
MKGLLAIAAEKISESAEMQKLQLLSRGIYLLYRWLNWDQSGRVAAWVNVVVRSSEGLTWFLRGMVDLSRQPDSELPGNPFFVNINNAKLFIDPETLQEIIESEDATHLTPIGKQLREALTRALGKSLPKSPSNDVAPPG